MGAQVCLEEQKRRTLEGRMPGIHVKRVGEAPNDQPYITCYHRL